MPHITLEFLDSNGNQQSYSTLISLAKSLSFAIAEITELNITPEGVSCSQITSTSLTPHPRIIAKVSCLLTKEGRDEKVVERVAKTVGETIKLSFRNFIVEVVIEPLVPANRTFTL